VYVYTICSRSISAVIPLVMQSSSETSLNASQPKSAKSSVFDDDDIEGELPPDVLQSCKYDLIHFYVFFVSYFNDSAVDSSMLGF
jgi:hypothetical protein